jgi:drug/metabolite transporter (DMT)-like permease
LRNVASLVAAAACWGGGTAVAKQAVVEVPPLSLLVLQLAVSVAVLVVVTRMRGEGLPAGREGRLLGRLGLLNPGLAYALSLIGLTGITASLSVLLWASEPILILLLASMVLGERLGLGLIVPTIVAVAGLVVAVFDPAAAGSLVGVGLTVAGVAACAVYTVAARKWLLGSDSTFGVVLAQQLYALAFALVVAIAAGATGTTILPERVTVAGLASAVASGLLYYALAYSFYISALRHVRASVAAASFYLIPVFGIAGGWLFGERLQPVQWIGAGLVVVSVAVISIRAAGHASGQAAATS